MSRVGPKLMIPGFGSSKTVHALRYVCLCSCCRDSGWVCVQTAVPTLSEPQSMALADRAVWTRARKTVHIYEGTRDEARAPVVWTHPLTARPLWVANFFLKSKCSRQNYLCLSKTNAELIKTSTTCALLKYTVHRCKFLSVLLLR
jgi:hypothetical protein